MPSLQSRRIVGFVREVLAGREPADAEVDAFVDALLRYYAERGGRRGGHERAKRLTKKRRREIAIKAAEARWASKALPR